MALVTTAEMFKKAYAGGYAVGAFKMCIRDRPGRTAEEAVRYLADAGAENVVVTLGGNGVMFKEGKKELGRIKPFSAKSEVED